MTVAHVPAVRRQSIRVALAATLVVGVGYLLIGIAVATFASVTLTSDIDRRLVQAFDRVPPGGAPGVPPADGQPQGPGRDPGRPYGLRFQVWFVAADGTVQTGDNSPDLPAALTAVTGPQTAVIDGTSMRVAGQDTATGRIIVAQSLELVDDTQRSIVLGWLLIAPFLLGSVFVGAVIIGRRVAAPIEAARRRQLEFTADASHELRTPLSVIEAHTSLALAQERDAGWYRGAFVRVDRESKRMRHLLEDMLWLARFDADAAPRATEPVDLGVLATQVADRFAAIAETRHLALGVHVPPGQVLVAASPELVDRLIGVLADNACKYAPEGGSVDLTVGAEGSRATVTVDDSGPGIPEEDRERVFDRFHRSVTTSTEAPGAGLGLAIGDAIVHATGARWTVGTSPAGGARFTVTWSRATVS
jgi:two-component system, OmpR family, sensor histidine kinase CiaH